MNGEYPIGGIDEVLRDRLGMVLGDLFDVHTAETAHHHHRALARAVDGDRAVRLLRDGEAALRRAASGSARRAGFWRFGGIGVAMISCGDACAPRAALLANLILPALPRPPMSTCALTTHEPGCSATNAAASGAVVQCCERGTGIPARRKSSFP